MRVRLLSENEDFFDYDAASSAHVSPHNSPHSSHGDVVPSKARAGRPNIQREPKEQTAPMETLPMATATRPGPGVLTRQHMLRRQSTGLCVNRCRNTAIIIAFAFCASLCRSSCVTHGEIEITSTSTQKYASTRRRQWMTWTNIVRLRRHGTIENDFHFYILHLAHASLFQRFLLPPLGGKRF